MDIPATQLPPGDPRLVEAIVTQLKTKGIFDQFRKECLADVDTKPAFQNLRQRVEGHVNKFLEKIVWKNDLNKNQLRDGVRKHVNSLGILDSGIDAIITQVVNPKIKPLILPYVEDTVYAFLQIDKPKRERQGATMSAPEDSVVPPVSTSPEAKPSLLPMETDVISSEEDDILARESPESEHKSPPSSHEEFMEPENEDAQDGFESFPPTEDNTDAVASHVEKLSLTDNTEESKPLPATKPPLPLFDDQSLDSISSNSSGLTFSTLSGKGSPGSRKSSDKDDSTKQEPRSATSTPLVDEKPMDEEISPPFVASEPTKEYPGTVSEAKTAESRSPSLDAVPMAETSHFISGTERDDQTVVSGASLISQDEDSQGSRASTSKASLSSFKSEGEEKIRSEKSEGELSTSSSESSDSDKSKPEQSLVEGKHYSDSSQKPSKSKGDHKSQDRDKDRDSKHGKDRDKKHSKSRDDHHSHRDKDKKHHRRDRDHDGDRERSRSHHYQSSSSSSSKDSSGSGKSSSDKDKEHSSQGLSDKSTEGKSRRDSNVEKENKSSKQTDNKVEGSGSESSKQNSTGEKTDGKLVSKLEGKQNSSGDKAERKHSSKSESKISSSGDKTDARPKSESKVSSSGDKADGKLATGKSESKSERSESKSNSKGDKSSKHSTKSEGKSDKHDSKSSSKSESSKSSKSSAEKTEKKHSVHSSKHSSKHKKHDDDSFYSDKLKSINIFKDDKKKKEEKDTKKDKGLENKQTKEEKGLENKHTKEEKGLENKHTKEEKEAKQEKETKEKKHSKEGKDQKKETKTREESHHREEKDHKHSKDDKDKDKEDKSKRNEKDAKPKLKDGTAVHKESDKSNSDKKQKYMKSKENSDRGTSGHETSNKKLKSHKASNSKKPSSPKDLKIKENELLLFNDEKNVMLISYEDDGNGDDVPQIKTKKLKRDIKKGLKQTVNNTKKVENCLPDKPVRQSEAKDPVSDFEGFSNVEKDTRLADFLATAHRVPDEMDMEFSDWFDENDLHMVVREDDIKERMDFSEFLSCMNKLGAIVQESSIDLDVEEESDSKDDDLSKTQDVPERRTRAQLQGKRRRISTSSSTSSSASLSGSPKHKRARTACMTSADAGLLVEQDPVIVSGFALLTPEDDGNRTSSRDYEVDYNQRINSYSPLSPASDSSADDGKAKVTDPGSFSGPAPPPEVSSQRVKGADLFKPTKTWTNEERNLSV